MKSGLGDRNNLSENEEKLLLSECLNEVRSWRPEQCWETKLVSGLRMCLNEVRSWRPEQ